MDAAPFVTVQLSWVDEVKRAGLSLIPAKGHVKAAFALVLDRLKAAVPKILIAAEPEPHVRTECDQGTLVTVPYLSKQSFV